jgi:cell wall assembly regulator SMI1
VHPTACRISFLVNHFGLLLSRNSMSHSQILAKIDFAIRIRDIRLFNQLRPGAPSKIIDRRLQNIAGDTSYLKVLYGWHDGTEPLRWTDGVDHNMSLQELSIVPGALCIFDDLEMAYASFTGWSEIARYNSVIGEAVGRYFPVLSDGSGSWLCVDLGRNMRGRVIRIDLESDQPCVEAYSSFIMFLEDLLRANEARDTLRCFLGC